VPVTCSIPKQQHSKTCVVVCDWPVVSLARHGMELRCWIYRSRGTGDQGLFIKLMFMRSLLDMFGLYLWSAGILYLRCTYSTYVPISAHGFIAVNFDERDDALTLLTSGSVICIHILYVPLNIFQHFDAAGLCLWSDARLTSMRLTPHYGPSSGLFRTWRFCIDKTSWVRGNQALSHGIGSFFFSSLVPYPRTTRNDLRVPLSAVPFFFFF